MHAGLVPIPRPYFHEMRLVATVRRSFAALELCPCARRCRRDAVNMKWKTYVAWRLACGCERRGRTYDCGAHHRRTLCGARSPDPACACGHIELHFGAAAAPTDG